MFSQRGAHLAPKQERQAVSIKPVMSLALLTLLSLQNLPAQAQSVGDIVSGQVLRQLMGGRMYPLTLEGLDRAMRELVR